jgi:hypothetical protein
MSCNLSEKPNNLGIHNINPLAEGTGTKFWVNSS